MRRLRDRRGSTLVINILTVTIFALLAGVVWVSARSQVKTSVYQTRQYQAQALAEAGLEDALAELREDASWRTGFTDKPFGDGTYTVTLSTNSPPMVVSTGYSKSIFGFGAAVKTVSAQTALVEGACPYAIAGNGPISIGGTINKYDPSVTLTPSTTEFTNGADVRSNTSISFTGAACPPVKIRGEAVYMSGTVTSSCVEEGVTLTTEPVTVPSDSCSTCSTINDNLTKLTPGSVYNDAAHKLTIGTSDVATMLPGKYYFRVVSIRGILNVDTTSGTVTIYIEPGTFSTFSGCQINNLSKVPQRLKFVDLTNSGHTLEFRCSTPLHAYLEGSFARTDLYQEFYGHFCSDRVTVDATGSVHYDGSSLTHAAWTVGSAGSWKESYLRQ